MTYLEVSATPSGGYYLEDLRVGQSARFSKTVSEADIVMYAGLSGDFNPVHIDAVYAAKTRFQTRIAHGTLTASFISAVLGMKLPGPGSIFVSLNLNFRAPVKIGDTVTASVKVLEIMAEKKRVRLECLAMVEDKPVIEGDSLMWVPTRG